MPLASATHSLPAGTLALIAGFSALGLAFGIAHYRGWHRSWLRLVPFEANFFLPAWYGAAGLLVTLSLAGAHLSRWIEVVLGVPAFVAFAIALMSLVWLPSWLLPAWYRDWRARGRPPGGLSA